jgi:ABC-2 type transport system permease protein
MKMSQTTLEYKSGINATPLTGHYRFSSLLRSEWTKMRTVRSTMWTLGVMVVLGIGLSAIATAETTSHWATTSLASRETFDPTQVSLIGVAFVQLVIGILGVLVVSAEYGTGTIRATLSAAPRRAKVLLAKVSVYGVVALVVSEAVAFISFFVGQSLLTGATPHTTLGDPGALRAVAGIGLYLCVLGILALGLAMIIRHTAGAICAFVGVLLILPAIAEALPSSIGGHIREFLPASIGNSMMSLQQGSGQLAPWAGFAMLCLYAVVAVTIGGVMLVRRDA